MGDRSNHAPIDMDTTTSHVLALPSAPQPCGGVMSEPVESPPPATNRWKAWDDFVEATPDTGFMQTSWWVEFRNYCGFENFGITLKDGNDIVGGAVVLKYSYSEDCCFYYIQDGPVLPGDPLVAEEIFRVVLEAIEDRRKTEREAVSHMRIEPCWFSLSGFVSGFGAIPPLAVRFLGARDTRCIDLRPSEEAILAQMKPKGRYNIHVAQRHGVSVVEDTSDRGLADFLRIYKRTAVRHRMETKPPRYFRTLVSMPLPLKQGPGVFA